MSPKKLCTCLFLASFAVVWVPTSALAAGLLLNGGFDTPTPGLSPPNYPTSISGAGSPGPSSAADWILYNNFDATTQTELLPSTDPSGSGFMIHLTSTPTSGSFSFFNGLQQAFPTQSGGTASVDVDVLSGVVLVALYANNGGTLISTAISTVNNQWQPLTVTAAPGTNPDLIVIYAENGTANTVGEFYADGAGVSVPEPAGGVLALIGLSATALWTRRAGRRSTSRRPRPSAGPRIGPRHTGLLSWSLAVPAILLSRCMMVTILRSAVLRSNGRSVTNSGVSGIQASSGKRAYRRR